MEQQKFNTRDKNWIKCEMYTKINIDIENNERICLINMKICKKIKNR